MSTVTILTSEGKELFFPKEVDENGRTWTWTVEALADGSLLLSLVSLKRRPPVGASSEGSVMITKEKIRFPKGSWIAQRWETARHSKRDRLTNQIIM